MQIIVNHLTRMTTPRICIAGVDVETSTHVRPVTPPDDLITRDLLHENGGPFGIGAVVDLGTVVPQPSAPETEDHHFRTTNARLVEMMAAQEYWEMLGAIQTGSVDEAFGPDLEQRGRSYALEVGHGTRSLAVVRVRGRPRLATNEWGKLRLSLDGPNQGVSLSVSDVRLWEPDHKTVREDVVSDVAARLGDGTEAYMMLGLARAFPATGDDRARHWVQVNGLCLADNPIGDTP